MIQKTTVLGALHCYMFPINCPNTVRQMPSRFKILWNVFPVEGGFRWAYIFILQCQPNSIECLFDNVTHSSSANSIWEAEALLVTTTYWSVSVSLSAAPIASLGIFLCLFVGNSRSNQIQLVIKAFWRHAYISKWREICIYYLSKMHK